MMKPTPRVRRLTAPIRNASSAPASSDAGHSSQAETIPAGISTATV